MPTVATFWPCGVGFDVDPFVRLGVQQFFGSHGAGFRFGVQGSELACLTPGWRRMRNVGMRIANEQGYKHA